ncbi:MAG: hypothetical protein KKB20_17230 [Proteobacteria bacterium]|nr:hypothetical protein [Pseudomonadota bacterium]
MDDPSALLALTLGPELCRAVPPACRQHLAELLPLAERITSPELGSAFIRAEAARLTTHLTDFLRYRYEERTAPPLRLMRRIVGGREIVLPLAVWPTPDRFGVDDIRGRLMSSHREMPDRVSASACLKILSQRGIRIRDNLMYELLDFEDRGDRTFSRPARGHVPARVRSSGSGMEHRTGRVERIRGRTVQF